MAYISQEPFHKAIASRSEAVGFRPFQEAPIERWPAPVRLGLVIGLPILMWTGIIAAVVH